MYVHTNDLLVSTLKFMLPQTIIIAVSAKLENSKPTHKEEHVLTTLKQSTRALHPLSLVLKANLHTYKDVVPE